MRAVLMILCLAGAASIIHAEEANIPDGVDGFSGWISGELVKKENRTLHVKVLSIKKLWKGNKAKAPENLVGKTIKVNEGWHRPKGKEKHEPNPWHLNFIQKVEIGKLDLEIRTGDGDRFHILELSGEQRKLAGVRPEKD